jgi:ribosomal small subunit protein bTHX
MGRGDVKTKKGKINRGSYGNSRPKSTAPKAAPTTAA